MNKTLFEKAQAFLASDGTEPMIVNDKVAIWADMEPEDGYISLRSSLELTFPELNQIFSSGKVSSKLEPEYLI